MTGYKITLKSVRYVELCILIVSLTTACSAGAGSQSQSQANPELGLSSSSRLSAEVAKPVQSADGKLVKKTAESLEVEPMEVQTTEAVIQPTDPSTTGSVEPVTGSGNEPPTLAPQGQQPLAPLPPVDPSLPVGPQVGLRAPDFTLQAMNGKTYHLSELAGQAVLINYWTTWCIPCKAELPILQKLHQEYQPRGVLIVSINAIDQDSPDKVQGIIDQFGMTFPVLLDQGSQFANLYQAIFFPTTILVDASGVIREITLGDSTEAELRTSLDKVLAGGL